MSYSESTSSIPFRSKKPNVEPKKKAKALLQKANECITTTPEKTSQLPNRARNRGVALSLKEVRKVAEALQQSKKGNQENEGRERSKSARRQINMSPTKPKKEVDGSTKLPPKYELLGEFFDGLDSSIRLLRLKGSVPSFTKICAQIECLTERRFTHGHLAQLKFILPEGIEVKKVLTFEERTSCMKPDLHIAMSADGIKSHGNLASEGGPMSLRKLFRARLTDFLKSHPEIDEIPEHPLPAPFNHSRNDHHLEMVKANASDSHVKQPLDASSKAIRGQYAAASHISQSFSRRFSQKHFAKKVDNVPDNVMEDFARHPDFSVADPFVLKDVSNGESGSSFSPSGEKIYSCSKDGAGPTDVQLDTPLKTLHSNETTDGLFSNMAYSESTPAKVGSTPSRLMSATPGLFPPKRSFMSPDSDSSSSPNKLVRRPPRCRSLKFDTPVKNMEDNIEDNNTNGPSLSDDIRDILPEDLLQSIREKERIAMEERNPAISQAKRRQKMIACLPKLFNMIHLLFHGLNRTVLTKEELVHKIISGHCDIIDTREVEEQLNLLLELVPEWICEKRASTGTLLLCINKISNAESIRALLQEAK